MAEATSTSEWPEPRWLEPHENPFGVKALDCRKEAMKIQFWTTSLNAAQDWAKRRCQTGEDLRFSQPPNAVAILCNLAYPYARAYPVEEGPRFLPQCMEDLWFIYAFEGDLVFFAGQQETVAFRARFRHRNDHLHIERIDASPHKLNGDTLHGVRVVDFLIKSHIYGCVVPHPIPASMPADIPSITTYSLFEFGRRGLLATFEDTLPLRWGGVDVRAFMGAQ